MSVIERFQISEAGYSVSNNMEPNGVNASGEVRVTVTLVLNASFSWLEKPPKSILTSNLATCIFLGLLAITALLLNLCVILAIFCSSSLRKITLNQLVSYMSFACFFDCSINVPFSLYYIKTNAWLLGTTLCNINAACIILFTLLVAWILCYMCMERYFSLIKMCSNKRCLLFCKQRVVIAIILVYVFFVVFPVAVSLVDVRAFPSRYSCYVATDSEISYRIIIMISFSVPVITAMISLICAYLRNFQGIKNINSQRTELSYTELFFEESYLWNEWQTSKFVSAIMMLFIFLELPVIVTFMKSTNVSLKRTKELANMHNSTVHVLNPIAQITSPIEKTYFWCKYLFCLIFPLVSLILRKDIRKKITVLLSLFRLNSSIPNNTLETPVPKDESLDDFLVPQAWKRRRLSSVTCLKSPIIFGKARSGSHQFMDLTTGIAKWKANYDEPKSSRIDRPIFADLFDDDDEITEFVSFQDFTEDELNSSELLTSSSKSKDVAVQTVPLKRESDQSCYNLSVKKQFKSTYDSRIVKSRTPRNRRLTKSFTYNRTNNAFDNYKYYMTFPKMTQKIDLEVNSRDTATSDLLRALQIKRSSRTNLTVCGLIPRGTEELLDSPLDSRDIVSL